MNRANRRKEKRNDKKAVKKVDDVRKWYLELSKEKRDFLDRYVQLEAETNFNAATRKLDQCITAAFITIMENISLEELNEVFELSSDYAQELRIKEVAMKNKYGGDYMAKIHEYEDKLIIDCTKLLNEGKNQKQSVDDLRYKYPELSTAQITNCFKKVKEDLGPIIKSVKSKNQEIENKREVEYKVENKEVKKIKEPENSQEIKDMEVKKMSSLKVKNIKLEIEGNNGDYVVEKGTVKLDKNSWTKDEWEAYKEEIDEVFKMSEVQ